MSFFAKFRMHANGDISFTAKNVYLAARLTKAKGKKTSKHNKLKTKSSQIEELFIYDAAACVLMQGRDLPEYQGALRILI